MYTAVSSWMEQVWTTLQKVYSAVKGVFDDELYLFFGETAFAYPSQKVVPWATASARPSWLYNATEGCFHEWCGSLPSTRVKGGRKATLPYLSLEIMEGERVAYDLTDFIERLVVYREGVEEIVPTVEQVVAAWSTGSHIVVDEARHSLRIMDTSAETIERGFHELLDTEEDGSVEWPPAPPACGTTA